jgi:hypothetical protein
MGLAEQPVASWEPKCGIIETIGGRRRLSATWNLPSNCIDQIHNPPMSVSARRRERRDKQGDGDFGLIAAAEGLIFGSMATEIECTCGAVWERTEVETMARDRDDFQCMCGRTLETWNRSRVPRFRLLKAPDEKR